jgi:hypothetical protein
MPPPSRTSSSALRCPNLGIKYYILIILLVSSLSTLLLTSSTYGVSSRILHARNSVEAEAVWESVQPSSAVLRHFPADVPIVLASRICAPDPRHAKKAAPPGFLPSSARIVHVNSTRQPVEEGTGGWQVSIRMQIGYPRASGASSSSCQDLVRVSLFNEDTTVASQVHNLENYADNLHSSFNVLAVASLPCGVSQWQVHVSVEWLDWRGENAELGERVKGAYGHCGCWPPHGMQQNSNYASLCLETMDPAALGYNLLVNSTLVLPACEQKAPAQQEPYCGSPAQLTRGYYKAAAAGLINPLTGTLGQEAAYSTDLWAAFDVAEWKPIGCRVRPVTPERLAPVLRSRTLVFVGDSTMVELFMLVAEIIQPGAWSEKYNVLSREHTMWELDPRYGFRSFDSGDSLAHKGVRLRLLWNAGARLPDVLQGLEVFRDELWLQRFGNFTQADGSRVTIFLGSGLHDQLQPQPGSWIDRYEANVALALAATVKRGHQTFWLSAVPKFRRYVCGASGAPGVRLLNAIAHRAVCCCF